MAKKYRHEIVGCNFSQWSNAEAFKDGYNAALGVKWDNKKAVKVVQYRDLEYTGYITGLKANPYSSGCSFVVVKTTALTEAEMKEIDRKKALKEAAEAELTAKIASQRAAKLREFAAG